MGNNIAKLAQDEYWDEVKNRILMRTVEDVNSTAGVLEWTALCFASWKGQLEITSLLLHYRGIEINKANSDGNTPLHEAAKHSHVDIVVLLMNAGANPHVINHDGLKPLDLASDNDITYFLGMCMLPVAVCAERCEWREVKRRLRARQISDINASFGENGWSLLTFATLHHQVDIATLLVRYKHIDVNFANRADGTTALHEAAAQSHVELVKLLLSAGADTSQRNAAGQVAYDVATSPDVQNLLIESTVAGFNTPTDVQTCAHCTYVNPATHVACQICGLDLNPEAKKTSNVDELLERIHALEEANLCAICQEYVKDTVFGCGHETCATCAAKLTECPHCRILIVTRIRRYI
ncbi:hypothetical protein H257_08632 [Aphanomyces astaci]|uniref:RING-type domain-containing protein n=2 Tax=Aphanomyces astaci TaxID=112090 RepID=W4GET8_APHAT|nr:hypothetical protein H257_08632 [Aphanomyces astaci]ETV77791.1 hypothetical protein H257_08632 [Aphanomyces astaci]|eukprot:XP_009832901.1 hypothetical protein H257_08632 [Aphanomyces astaci]